MPRSVHLLIVDPQNDFCDLPEPYLPRDPMTGQARQPALPVPGPTPTCSGWRVLSTAPRQY